MGGGADAGRTGADSSLGPADGAPDAAAPPMGMDGGTPPPPGWDGGMSTGQSAEYYESEDAARRAECECIWESDGYISLDQCVDVYGLPGPELVECHERAFLSHESVLRPYYRCLVTNNRAYAACLMASGCDAAAISRCQTMVDDANRSCPDYTFDQERAYMGSLLECTGGESSACPEGDSDRTGPMVFSGSTLRAGDDSMGSCVEFRAPDRAHRWTAPSRGTFLFETSGSSFNTVVYLLSACGGEERACNDNFADLTSQVEVTLEAGESVIVVVDGSDEESAGAYVINVYRGS